jgi:hypothetical protein
MAKGGRSLSIALICTSPVRAWQAGLAAALRNAGHTVNLQIEAPAAASQRRAVDRVLEFERIAYGAQSQTFAPRDMPADEANAGSDITIDLRDQPALQADEIRLVPLFDGIPGEAGLTSAMIDARTPEIAIVRWSHELQAVAHGSPVWENRNVLAYGLDQLLPRAAELLHQCITRFARGEEMQGSPVPTARSCGPSPIAFAARNLAARVSQRLRRLAVHPEHWTIAFRRLHGDAVIERGAWPDAAWTRVPDDGARYFADPFPFIDSGRIYVFCEEYPYATRKGLISLFEIVGGTPTNPRPIIERPYHLSYPMVFRRGSQIYMIPETSSVGRIELYRAESFPERWAFERVLVDGIIASDATLLTWQGRDWLFASIAGEGASTWDALGLFYADDLFGDWTAHPLNPVLIDAGAARPGGVMVRHGNRLRRVAQDCRRIYGGGIALADVDRLDPENYAQSVQAVLGPPPGSGAMGAHTLNVAGDFEFIDFVARKRRL